MARIAYTSAGNSVLILSLVSHTGFLVESLRGLLCVQHLLTFPYLVLTHSH